MPKKIVHTLNTIEDHFRLWPSCCRRLASGRPQNVRLRRRAMEIDGANDDSSLLSKYEHICFI